MHLLKCVFVYRVFFTKRGGIYITYLKVNICFQFQKKKKTKTLPQQITRLVPIHTVEI